MGRGEFGSLIIRRFVTTQLQEPDPLAPAALYDRSDSPLSVPLRTLDLRRVLGPVCQPLVRHGHNNQQSVTTI